MEAHSRCSDLIRQSSLIRVSSSTFLQGTGQQNQTMPKYCCRRCVAQELTDTVPSKHCAKFNSNAKLHIVINPYSIASNFRLSFSLNLPPRSALSVAISSPPSQFLAQNRRLGFSFSTTTSCSRQRKSIFQPSSGKSRSELFRVSMMNRFASECQRMSSY